MHDNPGAMLHRGKAPPIDSFTGEDITITFDDWLLTLKRAATWNGWTPDETLMQLAGHLRGRASQEWQLLLPESRTSYQVAVKALREKLDPGNGSFRFLPHLTTIKWNGIRLYYKVGESNPDGLWNVAIWTTPGRSSVSIDGVPSVSGDQNSGAQNYKELCLADKKEERRFAEL